MTDSVYIARNRSIKIPVSLCTEGRRAKKEALLDSGVTESFIHPRLIKELKIPLCQLRKKRNVRNVDGTPNRIGGVTHTANFMIQFGEYATLHQFLVAEIGEDDLILGYPFLEAANPTVDWITGTIKGTVALISYTDWDILPEAEKKTWFHATLAKATVAQQLAEQATNKKERTWQELVPKRYHLHGKVFSEKESEHFPSRRHWDHAIDLKSDAPTSIDCQVYPLAPRE